MNVRETIDSRYCGVCVHRAGARLSLIRSPSGTAFHRNSSAVLRRSTRVPRFHEYSENENRRKSYDLERSSSPNEQIYFLSLALSRTRKTDRRETISIVNSHADFSRSKRDIRTFERKDLSLFLSLSKLFSFYQTFRIKIPIKFQNLNRNRSFSEENYSLHGYQIFIVSTIDEYHRCPLRNFPLPFQLFLSIFPNGSIEKIAANPLSIPSSSFLFLYLFPSFLPLFVSIHLYRGEYNSGLRISLTILQGWWWGWVLSHPVFEQWGGERTIYRGGGEKKFITSKLAPI